MILVLPTGADRYSQYSHDLANCMPDIGVLQTETHPHLEESSWPGSMLLRSTWHARRFSRQLQRLREPIHLPAEQLARYAVHLQVPYVITVHSLDEEVLTGRSMRALRNAAALITFDPAFKDSLAGELHIPEERIHVLPAAPGARETHRLYEAIESSYYESAVNRASDAGFRVALSSPP